MKRIKRAPGMILRITCFALVILFASGIVEDYGDPYTPFLTTLAIYIILYGGPLLIMFIITNRYCRHNGERFWGANKSEFVFYVACSFPVSGFLRLGIGLLITGQSKQRFLDESMRFLTLYIVLSLLLFAFSAFLKFFKRS